MQPSGMAKRFADIPELSRTTLWNKWLMSVVGFEGCGPVLNYRYYLCPQSDTCILKDEVLKVLKVGGDSQKVQTSRYKVSKCEGCNEQHGD